MARVTCVRENPGQRNKQRQAFLHVTAAADRSRFLPSPLVGCFLVRRLQRTIPFASRACRSRLVLGRHLRPSRIAIRSNNNFSFGTNWLKSAHSLLLENSPLRDLSIVLYCEGTKRKPKTRNHTLRCRSKLTLTAERIPDHHSHPSPPASEMTSRTRLTSNNASLVLACNLRSGRKISNRS